MKSIIKLLGLSIGCSCTAITTESAPATPVSDPVVLATVITEVSAQETPSALSRLQDIDKIYAI